MSEAKQPEETASVTSVRVEGVVRCTPTEAGVFVARKQGVCLRISIPAQTGNDWRNEAEFLDLPLMDKETFDVFISTVAGFASMYDT